MKNKILLLPALILLAIVLGGCATGMTPSSWYGMATDEMQIYVSGGTNIYAVDLDTHAEAWRFPIKGTVFAAPVLTSTGQLLVGGFDHILYSLDPVDGSENWKFEEAKDRWIASPLSTDDTIYAPNADYSLYALTQNGSLKWSYKADQSLWGTPVSDGERIYFGSLGGWIYALDATNGELVWKIETEGAILGSPVLDSDRLFVSLYAGQLAAYNTRDGRMVWQEPLEAGAWSGPLLYDDTLYVGDGAGNLYSFDLSGRNLWQKPLIGSIINAPLLVDDELVVGTDAGNVYFISLDGRNARNISIEGQIQAPLLQAGSMVFVSQTGADSILVALEEGSQSWSFKPEK